MLESWAAEDIYTQASELELGLSTSLVNWGPRDIKMEKKKEMFLKC